MRLLRLISWPYARKHLLRWLLTLAGIVLGVGVFVGMHAANQSVLAAFNETVNLGLLEGIYIRYAQVLETSQPLRAILKPGARDLFHTTALGRAIVARLPEQQQSRLIAKVCATEPAGKRRVARARLEAELAATRARGCAWEEEETVAGVACAAIALTALG